LSGLTQHEKLDRLYELGYIKIVPGQTWPIYEHYLTPEAGSAVSDMWTFQPHTGGTVFGTDKGIDEDVRWLSTKDQERLGYPTQKLEGILERIIRARPLPGLRSTPRVRACVNSVGARGLSRPRMRCNVCGAPSAAEGSIHTKPPINRRGDV
jgi:hypothetical protein